MTETLDTADGHSVLTMERRLEHPPEKVWRALTEPERLARPRAAGRPAGLLRMIGILGLAAALGAVVRPQLTITVGRCRG